MIGWKMEPKCFLALRFLTTLTASHNTALSDICPVRVAISPLGKALIFIE